MIDHLGNRLARAAFLAVLAGLTALPACAEGPEQSSTYAVSVGEAREVAAAQQPGEPARKEFVVEIRKQGVGTPRRLVFAGPDKMIGADERPDAAIVGQRLLVHTRAVIAVFDLQSGEKELEIVAAPEVAATADGRRIAFKELQLPFTPAEASTTVIQVLDVETLEIEPVFPDRREIETGQLGRLQVWEEDPMKRHSAGKLFWSPDGMELAFLCTHGELGMPDSPHETYLVVVDLHRGLDASRFVHQEVDWERYLKPGSQVRRRDLGCAAAEVTWEDDEALAVKPASYCSWLQDKIVLPMPDLAGGPAGARKEEN